MTSAELRTAWKRWECFAHPEEWVTLELWHVRCPVPEPAAEPFKALEQALRATGYNPSGGDTGTYNCRPIMNEEGNPLSLHSYGIALDLDWLQNPLGGTDPWAGELNLAQVSAVLGIKNTHGEYMFTWGGYWSIRDRMHFQLDVPPDRTVVDWSTVKEEPMALPKDVEDFVMALYNSAKQRGSNGYALGAAIDLVRKERVMPLHNPVDASLPSQVEATITFKGGDN